MILTVKFDVKVAAFKKSRIFTFTQCPKTVTVTRQYISYGKPTKDKNKKYQVLSTGRRNEYQVLVPVLRVPAIYSYDVSRSFNRSTDRSIIRSSKAAWRMARRSRNTVVVFLSFASSVVCKGAVSKVWMISLRIDRFSWCLCMRSVCKKIWVV